MKKFKFIRRLILLFIVLSIIGLGYYTYVISPTHYRFSSYEYENKKISTKLNGFKIAFISDIYLTNKKSIDRLNDMVKELNEYPFDMIVFGGDLFDKNVFEAKQVSSALKSIQCKYGKFAILGEKDTVSSLEVTQILNDGGFEVLGNTTRPIYYKDESFLLIASDESTDISTIDKESPTIKIGVTHQPDSFASHSKTIDIQLSGHSYGGSVYIPYYGSLMKNDGSHRYNHGTYVKGNATLVVSNGFSGPPSFPYKFLAPNEVKFITLKTK